MNNAQAEMKRAVDAGYWPLYRFDPRRGDRPFVLDSKEPTLPFREFLEGEVRYASLHQSFPQNAQTLFADAEKEAKERYDIYRHMQEEGI